MNRARQHLSGELVIYVTDNIVGLEESPLVDAVSKFSRQHPEVFLNVTSASAHETELAVLNGRADLGVALLVRRLPSLETIPLFEEMTQLYCGAKHRFFTIRDEDLPFERVGEAKMIETQVIADPTFAAIVGRIFSFAARSSTMDARIIMILSGEYLGLLPVAYAKPWVDCGLMRAIRPDVMRTSNPICALFNRASPANLIAEEFRRTLLAAYGTAPEVERPDATPLQPAGGQP